MPAGRDPVADYLAVFERLRARKRWTTDTATFRFVALTLGAVGDAISYERLEETAAGLRKRARWTSPLRSELRYVVAAMILRRELDPSAVHEEVVAVRERFRRHGIRRGGTGATLAALVLVLQADGKPTPASHLQRLALIYARWRADHFWLTDAEDLPAAALHATRDTPVDFLTADVERAYARLREAGFRRGDSLQLVSHLLAVDPRGTDAAVQRFGLIAERLRAAGERVSAGRYDEVAVLALTRGTPWQVVDRVLEYRDRLRRARPRPDKDLAFSLAAGLELADDSHVAAEPGRAEQGPAAEQSAADLATLQSIRAILDAQQAAMIAAMGAAGAASSGS